MNRIYHDYLAKLRQNFVHRPTGEQEEALQLLARKLFVEKGSPVVLLRGYAGTGKTSVISAVVRTLRQQGIAVVLLAPTGRGACRQGYGRQSILHLFRAVPASRWRSYGIWRYRRGRCR